MNLQLLTTMPALSIYYDTKNDWLYLDWQGDLTLQEVQAGCFAVAQCFLTNNYTRVLNDKSNVTSFPHEVASWLTTDFLPYIQLTSIQYIAWTYSPGVDTWSLAENVLRQVTKPVVAVFDDLESAYAWLKAACYRLPGQRNASSPSVADKEEFRIKMQSVVDQITAHRQQMALAS